MKAYALSPKMNTPMHKSHVDKSNKSTITSRPLNLSEDADRNVFHKDLRKKFGQCKDTDKARAQKKTYSSAAQSDAKIEFKRGTIDVLREGGAIQEIML